MDSYEYVKLFNEYNHHFDICITEHNRIANTSYQWLQAANPSNAQLCELMAGEKAMFDSYNTKEGVLALLGANMKKAASMYAPILKTAYFKKTAEDAYASKANETYGGVTHDKVKNIIVLPDPIAVLQHIGGLKITGMLEEGECHTKKFEYLKKIASWRYPILDAAVTVTVNTEIIPIYRWMFTTGALFKSIHGTEMRRKA